MFSVSNLIVNIGEKRILDGFSLDVKPGEIHAIMGPNGAGKSSLAKALLGYPGLETKGSIKLDSQELSDMPTDERAKAGLFLAFQDPQEIEGLKLSNLIRKSMSIREGDSESKDLDVMVRRHEELIVLSSKLNLDKTFINRELNVGASGGERKRVEILQMMALKPKIIILDEVDSGLDIDGIKLIAKAISDMNDGKRMFIIITHYPRIFKYLTPNKVHVLAKGRLVKSGDAKLAHEIEEHGYGQLAGLKR